MKKLAVSIVGAGPAGVAAAVELKTAKIENIAIFEKSSNFCSTIRRLYPEGKRVDTNYKGLNIAAEGVCFFETETKEKFLERIERYIKDYKIKIFYNTEINGLERLQQHYILKAGTNAVAQSYIVVIATGVFDKPKKPSYPIPDEIKDRVFFELPKELPEKEKVLIVGGGNTAAELACILSGRCDVYLSYRRKGFFRINEENLKELEKRKDQITFFLGTDIKALEPEKDAVRVIFQDGRRETFSKIFYCLGGSTPRNFLEKMGIKFKDSLPDIDEFGESNLERVFLIGDIAVKRGSILYAFNSAHKTVKRIIDKYHSLLISPY
ncbi:MAG: NAD(P)-binding domain-containing protein [Thermodesulfovibrio sp.]|nr:NAD(P)-binding domain-containing protein [Thermodesulfovibrio sp.]MCX7724808.1 NAD(P)-binding domain-containing protein [Thermodesulfovibrio sp.]MDW7971660.1 NAD(P)-binding domain-containing protein [Thermodesulfovibrio sp.]